MKTARMVTDLEYRNDGLFTRFYPNTPAGEDAWREIAAHNEGVAAVPFFHAKSVLHSLRQAGYCVKKLKKTSLSKDEIDGLLAEYSQHL